MGFIFEETQINSINLRFFFETLKELLLKIRKIEYETIFSKILIKILK
jgi:hypothetical protein